MNNPEITATAVISDRGIARVVSDVAPTELAGYQLQELIGKGGYGEVWRGIGPGGFAKAVKILYGQSDGPQAECELRALELMRELRHPFLLSVERVELIDGRLIVVTELADRSLEQRFQDCLRAGGRGIPRDELIGYLRDVSDALDFMSAHHGLQHLDIKPDNILIQGTHAKIGDFGLTKSVGVGKSSINGFTPLYAPPELLEGRATHHSDQYSLAIVFQHMLTGAPPFNGRNSAQLAAQHMKGTPDLSPLSPADRSVVARALSRNPGARFDGCRKFIDEVARRRPTSGGTIRETVARDEASLTVQTRTLNRAMAGIGDSVAAKPATPLPPLDGKPIDTVHRPTLFVCVGGIGIRIAEILRSQFAAAFPNATLPSVSMICIDSDREVISRVNEAWTEPHSPELQFETVSVPLKQTADYRKSSSEHLAWLGRRWLFNIPRTGNVEGMRPLGRLAFIDHQQKIQDALLEHVCRITSQDAINATVIQTGLPFVGGSADVCLIGATSGGTASGCMIDLGFLIRRVLQGSGLTSARVSAMLIHSTSVGRQNSDTQDANSVSFLKELNYYNLRGTGWTGDGRSSTSGGRRAPFDSAFFVHLGDDLTNSACADRLSMIGNYLQRWVTSPQRQDLEAWRQFESAGQVGSGELQLRTLGGASIDGAAWNVARSESETLALQLVQRWLVPTPPPRMTQSVTGTKNDAVSVTEQVDPGGIGALLESLSLTEQQTADFVPGLLKGDIGKRIEAYSADVWKRITQQTAQLSDLGNLVARLASMVGADAVPAAQSSPPGTASIDSVARITQTVRQELNTRLQQSMIRINQHLLLEVDRTDRLRGAENAISLCLARMEHAITACAKQKSEIHQTFTDLCSNYMHPADRNAAAMQSAPRNFCQQYCLLLAFQTMSQCAILHLTALRDYVKRQQTELIEGCRASLQRVAECLLRGGNDAVTSQTVLDAFEQFQLSSGQFRLSALIQSPAAHARMGATLASDATCFLLSTTAAAADSPETPGDVPRCESFPANANPELNNVGGGRRVLAILPRHAPAESWRPRLQAEFGECVVIRHSDDSQVSAFCEVEGITPQSIIDSLSNLRPRVAELSERLHSRIDIAW